MPSLSKKTGTDKTHTPNNQWDANYSKSHLSGNLPKRPKEELSNLAKLKLLKIETKGDEAPPKHLKDKANEIFAAIKNQYEDKLIDYIRKNYNLKQEAAEDIVQNVLMKLYRYADVFDGKSGERPYIYAVTSNTAIDYIRRNKRHTCLSLDQEIGVGEKSISNLKDYAIDPKSVDPMINSMRLEVIKRLQAETPDIELFCQEERQHRSYNLAFAKGETYKEVAAADGNTVGTVKSRAHSEKKKIRELFGPDLEPLHDMLEEYL